MSESDVLLTFQDVSIGYRKPLLPPIQFELRRGEFWGVVGPNGAGKTTFAKTLLGLIPPLSGTLQMAAVKPRFSYTPQRHRLHAAYPLTVMDVVVMGRLAGRPIGKGVTDQDQQRAEEELERLGMHHDAGILFRTLSGGQQQRVLLARALTADPDVLVLDEPVEGMDLLGTQDILAFLQKTQQTDRMSVLMISHHLDDVISSVDHLCFVSQYANRFETGTTEQMASSQKLTQLYGRTVETHACAGKTHVHIQSE